MSAKSPVRVSICFVSSGQVQYEYEYRDSLIIGGGFSQGSAVSGTAPDRMRDAQLPTCGPSQHIVAHKYLSGAGGVKISPVLFAFWSGWLFFRRACFAGAALVVRYGGSNGIRRPPTPLVQLS